MENKKYQDVMSRLSVTPEMAERVLQGIKDMEDIRDREAIKRSPENVKEDLGNAKEDLGNAKEDLGNAKEDPGNVKEDSGIAKEDLGNVYEEPDSEKNSPGKANQDSGRLLNFEDKKTKRPKGKKKKSRRFGRFSQIAAALAFFLVGSLVGVSLAGRGNGYNMSPAMESDYSQEDGGYVEEEESYNYEGAQASEDYDMAAESGQDSSNNYSMSAAVPDQEKTGSQQDGSGLDGKTSQQDTTGTKDNTGETNVQNGQKLIYSASVRIETEDYPKSLEKVKTAIQNAGGYIESENETSSSGYYGYDGGGSATSRLMRNELVIRVPAAEYNSFLEGMPGIGSVVSKSQNVDNVTSYYHDTEVQIKALKIQEERLLQMMEKAVTIEDMIMVENRLTEVQTELDSYESALKGLDDQVAYSRVNLSLNEVKKYTESPEASFGQKAKSRLQEGFENFAEGMVNLILAILYLLPVIITITLIVVLVRFILKKKGWKLPSRKKKDQEMDPNVFDE